MGGCGECLAKFGLITFNFIFLLSGIAVLGVGIWVTVDKNVVNMQNLVEFDSDDKSLTTAAYVLIGFGSFVLVVSAFGFLAACCASKTKFFIIGYIMFLVIIFIGEFAGGITAAVFKGKIDKELPDVLKNSFKHYGSDTSLIATAWNYMQVWLNCCGSDGPQDYKKVNFTSTNQSVPNTCCILKNEDPIHPNPKNNTKCWADGKRKQQNSTKTYKYTDIKEQGCYSSLEDKIKSHIGVIIGVAVGIAMFQLLGIVMSICICKRERENNVY